MIKFWSYKNEYKKYRPKLNRFFDQTLKRGQIFFGPNLKNFENKFINKYKSNMVLQLVVVQMHFNIFNVFKSKKVTR